MSDKDDMVEKMHSTFALMLLSESELTQLLNSIALLQVELKGIPLPDDKLAGAITSTQKVLNLWKRIVERIFTVKQAKDANVQLGNWDNEGGRVERSLYPL